MDAQPSTHPSLLVRLRDMGDERAWSEFTEIYGPLVHRFARRRGRSRRLTPRTLFRKSSAPWPEPSSGTIRAIERYDPDPDRGSFRGWLFRIARNLIINLLAAQRRHPQGTGDRDVQRMLEQCPEPGGEDSALFDAEYRGRLVAWAVERIRGDFSEAAWQAFWRSSVEGRPAKEVADSLGITLGTVYQYKSRVVVRIRRELAQFEWESTGELSEVTQWYRDHSAAIATNPD